MADKGELGWRVMAAGAAFAGGWVAKKAITMAWKQATGKEPPATPESPEVALAEALGWAVAVGVGSEIAKLLLTRAVAKRWAKGTGALPLALQPPRD